MAHLGKQFRLKLLCVYSYLQGRLMMNNGLLEAV